MQTAERQCALMQTTALGQPAALVQTAATSERTAQRPATSDGRQREGVQRCHSRDAAHSKPRITVKLAIVCCTGTVADDRYMRGELHELVEMLVVMRDM